MPPGRPKVPALSQLKVDELLRKLQHHRRTLPCPSCKETPLGSADPIDLPESANDSRPLTFEHHESLPAFMQQLMDELNNQRRRLDQHDLLYAELQQLKQKLIEANARVAELERLNSELQDQLRSHEPQRGTMASIHAPNPDVDDFPELSTFNAHQVRSNINDLPSVWNQPDRTRRLRHALPTGPNPRKQEAATRAFMLPSRTHGFQYVYLPARARIPTGKDALPSATVRQVTAILLHNDYVPAFLQALAKFGVKPLETFDPTSPNNLRDPKYANHPTDERQKLAKDHHNLRMMRALDFLRIPVRFAVARQFASFNWITVEQLREVLAIRLTSATNNRSERIHHAADIFQNQHTTTDVDEQMLADNFSFSSMIADEPPPVQTTSPHHE
ncbi:hypothetical protein EC973_009473 [Apophysomyces ossiformis]|uniref:Uncharacterized protein n=1 Tax=Apophysomyces ossiformis TaxID=679940 RepID=A0A8H7BLY8_9FUNG|nr:hypothetical protein EC973_009473 [Apophysomyces ossiformis]